MPFIRIVVLLAVTLLAADAARARQLQWNLRKDFQSGNLKQNPNRDRYGNRTWYFLRTTNSMGPVATRNWQRDGVYVSLNKRSQSLFNAPHDGWIFRLQPTALAPFVSVITQPYNVGVQFAGGEICVAPGPTHAVVVGWRSPVNGRLTTSGVFEHAQKCCGINSQINWYVEQGSGPSSGARPMKTLAQGVSDFGTPTQNGRFKIDNRPIRKGEFLYFVVDSRADGTAFPHHGDATKIDVTINVETSDAIPIPTFEKDIRSILASRCHECHGADAKEAGLDLRTVTAMIRGGESGPAIVPGHPERSYLMDLISKREMPPKDHKPLSNDEIAKIDIWLRFGAKSKENISAVRPRSMVTAKDRQYWAFRSPQKKTLPQISLRGRRRARTSIDRLLLARLEKLGLTFSPDASRIKLIRRATVNLTGLPPTPREVREFVKDERPDAYEQLIDRLLASPHYGERWGRHWLDAAGYVDVRLFDGDFSSIYYNEGIWRYRDYVVAAHNRDLPWDRFLQEQLAGDEMVDWKSPAKWSPAVRDKIVATGFLRMIEDPTSEAQYGVKQRYDVLFDLMNLVSTSVMGLTLDCCRCHNHKFDPLPQRDYYRFMANFESAYNVRNWLKPQNRWLADVAPKERKRIDMSNSAINGKIAQRNKRRQAALKAKDKKTAAKLAAEIGRLKKGLQSYGRIQALFDVGGPPQTRLLRRGNHATQGISITAGFPEILSAPGVTSAKKLTSPTKSSGQRLALARWLTERRHPLTARVIVNRVWQHHFGRGIVTTPENFGRSGSQPSHPEVLDWLAVEFIEQGWSLKHLHRLIMTSTAYRQQSQRPANANVKPERVDPTNKLLWRMNLQRLDAEIVRDSVLAVSQQLDRRQGGPAVRMALQNNGLSMVKTDGNQQARRSLYILARRVYPLRFLEVFDSPIMPINCTQRPTSATVLQSFTFLNGPFVLDAAKRLAKQVQATAPKNAKRQIQTAYQRILTRPPRPFEVNRCLQFLEQQARTYKSKKQQDRSFVDLCHMLLCTNEFLYVD